MKTLPMKRMFVGCQIAGGIIITFPGRKRRSSDITQGTMQFGRRLAAGG